MGLYDVAKHLFLLIMLFFLLYTVTAKCATYNNNGRENKFGSFLVGYGKGFGVFLAGFLIISRGEAGNDMETLLSCQLTMVCDTLKLFWNKLCLQEVWFNSSSSLR